MRNLEKVGLKCLRSDIELISEEKAREINPEAFIVLPWNFKKEIVEKKMFRKWRKTNVYIALSSCCY